MKNKKYEIMEFILWPIYMLILSSILFQKIPNIKDINIKAYLFTIILFIILNILFDSIFKRKTSKIVQIILLYLLTSISIMKYYYTNEPLFISDILFFNNIGEISSLASNSIFKNIFNSFFLNSFMIIISIFLYNAFINKYLNEYSKKRKKISILLLIIFTIVNISFKDFILNNIYDVNKQISYKHNVSYIQYYLEDSFIGGMYRQYLESKYTKPKNYDKNKLNKIIKKVKDNNDNKLDNTNIIVMFSESFFDVSLLKDNITFDKDITENFNKLKSDGIFVNMISPTYGGLSSNVEFELLTGNSMNFMPNGTVPFMQLYTNKNKIKNSLTLIKELKNNDYYTEVVFGKDYYKSENTYKNLGIDKYTEYDKGKIKGLYTSDEYLVNKTIERLEKKKKNQKLFYMNCTIQSHMPYVKEKYKKYDINIKETNLNKNQSDIILSYAQGVYDADQTLGKLYEYIKSYDEKTIILFFGDHLPYLKNYLTKENIFDSLSYFNTEDTLINTYRKYNTQGLILANYDISNININEYISPDLLLTSILNNLDIKLNNYYKWLYNESKDLSSMNFIVSQDNNGNIKWINKINNKQKEYMNVRENMQYRYILDNN